jgi:hypothetical protein
MVILLIISSKTNTNEYVKTDYSTNYNAQLMARPVIVIAKVDLWLPLNC